MSKYEEMSDFELSVEVANKKGGDVFHQSCSPVVLNGEIFSINNWSDMGPVIEANRIGLHPNDDGTYKAFTMVEDSEYYASEYNACGALRAAAICYLEMGE